MSEYHLRVSRRHTWTQAVTPVVTSARGPPFSAEEHEGISGSPAGRCGSPEARVLGGLRSPPGRSLLPHAALSSAWGAASVAVCGPASPRVDQAQGAPHRVPLLRNVLALLYEFPVFFH